VNDRSAARQIVPHHGRNHVQFEASGHRGIAHRETRELHHARDAGQRVDRHLDAVDGDAADARSPSWAARDDLRRELWTHFEDAGTPPDDVREAMRRFGAEAMVTASLRRVYCVWVRPVCALW
jgi:hypothetical protein